MNDALVDEKEKQKHFILNGNLWRVMANLSWPAIVAMVLYGMNSVLDAFFVGRFVGEDALAGVSVAYPLSQISVAFGSLIGVGAGSALSIAIGAKDKRTQERLLGNVNLLSFIVTVIYMLLGLLFSKELIAMMGGKDEALVMGDQYFRITIYGAFFWVYGLAGNMIIRAEGRMKTAAVMMGIGLAVDAVFKYLFVVVFQWGIEGAAWATNIGMLVYTLVSWIYFGKGWATFHSRLVSVRWDKAIGTSMLRLGMSSLIMSVMSLVQAVFVFNALSKYGTTADVAFYGVVYRIFTFLMTPIFGLMRALQPVIGINYGAQRYQRVISSYKIFAVTAMVLTLPFWILSIAAPGAVLGLIMKDAVFAGAELMYFRVYMAILPVLSFIFMAMTLFPSVDKGKPAAVIGIARQLVFYVPVMLLLPKTIGVKGIYYGSFAIDAVIVIWTMFMVRKEFSLLRQKSQSAPMGTMVKMQS
ncbi:putative MATE family efflux protein [Anaerobacterium chartisolvens]|uniref:Multidrug export protein MepA n=1 Tax=Anaerobacterium chartisolvens TaxID=1297424 RepID=A0A369B4U9_9FIRM|nr:MATE family efflux transporter [Anaerobacterium chartisolvens]RCX16345.1 putative MATE family efflux protein [Anaerobacterium chartisolvens]